MSKNLIFGCKAHCSDLEESLQIASANGLEFISIPLFHPRLRRDSIGISAYREGPLTKSDLLVDSHTWISNVVGYLSTWVDLDNSATHLVSASEISLHQELLWAVHLGLQSIILPPPRRLVSPNYAKFIIKSCSSMSLWIRIPLLIPFDYTNNSIDSSDDSTLDGWTLWDNLRKLTGYNHKICIAIDVTEDLPQDIEDTIGRWSAEPVRAVILSTNIFLTNKGGHPVLSKQHQKAMAVFLRSKVHIVFEGKPQHVDAYVPYIQYIQYLQQLAMGPLTEGERFTYAYRDTLQSPLQPLMDNLESQTYEVFERDPVKYSLYERAINKYLTDLSSGEMDRPLHDMPTVNVMPVVCMVVGAGRGPLVACLLSASAATGIPVKVYAIEKNENAVITLRNRVLTEYWTNVTVVHMDMRYYQPTELADLMISELLGSFGDNELSPECLDGAQRFLKPGGVSIPSAYSSYLAPMASSRLWMGARDMADKKGLDTPFVVKFHNCQILSVSKPMFTFEHPNVLLTSNYRYGSASFESSHTTNIHGFAGTFECTLYKDVCVSINPQTFSEGMFSWFPIFFPLNRPVPIKKGETVTVNMWRCVDARKVWYEWCLISPEMTTLQNVNGENSWIGLH